MPSIDHPQPEFPAGEELVAYLDGELPPDDCRRVEERLAVDEDYRRQLRELDQAWEALDVLPQSTADADFARTTIEMVALAGERDLAERSQTAVADRRKRRLLWTAAGAAAVLAGFAAVRWLAPKPNETLLADLPVIAQFDLLSQIEDVDFLQRLAKTVPLDQLAEDRAAMDREVKQLQAASTPSREERRRWIESLSDEEKADLAAQARGFQNLARKPDEQQRLRKLERDMAAAADADTLRKTSVAYGQWLGRRTAGEQEELRSLSTNEERINRIQQYLRQDDQRAGRQLSAEDLKKLRNEILAIAEEHRPELDQMLKAAEANKLGPADPLRNRSGDDPEQRVERRRATAAFLIVLRELWNDETREATRDRLVNQLSPTAKQHLENLGRSGRERRTFQLRQWMQTALEPKHNPQDLEKFFAEQLDNNQRERLLSLSTGEMEAELERLYLGAQLGLRGAEWMGRIGEPGRGPRNPQGGREFPPERRPREFGPGGPPGGPGPGGPDGPPPRRDGGERGRFEPDRGPPSDGPRGPRREMERNGRLRPDRPPPPGEGPPPE